MNIEWFYKGSTNQKNVTDWMDSHKFSFDHHPNDIWTDIEPFCCKYLHGQIIADEEYLNNKTFTISESYVNNIKLRYPFMKPDYATIKVNVVYFANLYIHPKGLELVKLQLQEFINTGILTDIINSKLYIVISLPSNETSVRNTLTTLFKKYDLVSKIEIITTRYNGHEYPGISKVYELAKPEEENSVVLYFHSKGISRFKGALNDPYEIRCFNEVIRNWRWVLFIFMNFLSIDRVGLTSTRAGWLWHNFWWIRSNYIHKLEKPILTDRRHYYEDWLARELPIIKDLNNGGQGIYDVDRKVFTPNSVIKLPYNLRDDNCWSLLQNPPQYLNVGTDHNALESFV